MNCVQSLFLIQKILLSVSLAWSQRKARFPIPRLRAVLFPWASVTGRMQPLNSGNIKILTAIKKLWSEKWNSSINKRHLWSSLSSPFRGKIIQLTAVANGSMQLQIFCQKGIANLLPCVASCRQWMLTSPAKRQGLSTHTLLWTCTQHCCWRLCEKVKSDAWFRRYCV